MSKSKLVLFRSPSRSIIIYLDPSKKGNETCICKFHDQSKTILLKRQPLAEPFLGPKANLETFTDDEESLPLEQIEEVKGTNFEKPFPQPEPQTISGLDTSIYDDEALQPEEVEEVEETYFEKHVASDERTRPLYIGERSYSGEVLRAPSSAYKELSFTHKSSSGVSKSDSGEPEITPETSEIFEIYPETSFRRTSNLQVADSSILKGGTESKDFSEDNLQSSENVLTTDSDVKKPSSVAETFAKETKKVPSDIRKTKKLRKAQFAPVVETMGEVEQNGEDEESVEIDEEFITNFTTILEASSLSARRKQFDELLRNISAVAFETTKTGSEDTTGCWKVFKRKKGSKKKLVVKPTRKSRASVPYFNHSFYHYTLKSRLEGLSFLPHRNYNFGEKGSGFQTKGAPQDFYQLRDQCLERGVLFEDPEFPPSDSSLFFSHRPDRRFEWKRPGEICQNPQLFVEGFSRFDVQQGELGDCWLLAAVANLTLYRRLFFQIVPDDQSFEEKYAGIFHFRFWQYGRWIDVVIDDRLPTYRGELVFLHSTEANEFWSALLEKAYAKLHGSYEALKGGSTCEAMEDFTGGVTEMYEMDSSPPKLFKIVLKAYERWSLMGCSIEPDPDVLEAQTPQGLIRGHAYSITKVQYVNIATPNMTGKIPLLRLRNPWGNESEWNGAFSDNAPEWQYIAADEKEELGLNFDADGEFWMSFKDFQTYFSRLEICNLNPDSLSEDELTEGRNKKWVMSVFEGEWVRGVTAGGCRNFLDTFWHNPQYRVTLEEVDEGEDEDKCTMIVALMQKNRRQLRSAGAADLLTIGFAIYHLPYPDKVPKPLNLNFFKYNASVARSPSFINLREVSCRFKLPRGTYCIVPSTYDPNEEGEFLLRVFSEHQNHMQENDQEVGITDVDDKGDKKKLTSAEQREYSLIMELFKRVAGKDNEVDWHELQEILNYYTRKETKNKGFSKDICRSMIAMLDADRTGKLNFEEFNSLWRSIRLWKNVFKKYDKDNSGTLTGFELRSALESAGYTLNNHTLNVLMHRYGNKRGEIDFDDFIMCTVRLKTMIDLFQETSNTHFNTATFTLDDWIETTLYS